MDDNIDVHAIVAILLEGIDGGGESIGRMPGAAIGLTEMKPDHRKPWERLEDELPRLGPGPIRAVVQIIAALTIGCMVIIGMMAVFDHRHDLVGWLLEPIR